MFDSFFVTLQFVMLQILNIVEDTMVDGPGFRTSIYCAGCRHQCPGCHNPQSWDFSGGYTVSTEEVMRIIEADPYTRGVTFSGGDPKDTGIVISIDEDDSDDGNRINHWTNHLWDD